MFKNFAGLVDTFVMSVKKGCQLFVALPAACLTPLLLVWAVSQFGPGLYGGATAQQQAQQTAQPAAKPAQKPSATTQPKAAPASEPAAKPAAKAEAKPQKASPTPKPQAKPVAKPDEKPPAKPSAKPGGQPAAPRPEPTIVFNFRNAPWTQVLDRFAQLAELSLVMEVAPPGTFTYFDQKPYTITQALDLINRVLLSKGFLLIRNQQFLILVTTDQPIPPSLVPVVEPGDLARRADNELVRLSLPLQYASPDSIIADIKSLQSTLGSATALPKLKRLLVTDLVANLRRIHPLVVELDSASKPQPPKPKKKQEPETEQVLDVQHLDPGSLASALQSLFDGATVLPLQGRSKLLVRAKSSQLERITKLLTAIDQPATSEESTVEAIYPLKHLKAQALSTSLQTLFAPRREGTEPAPSPPRVRVSFDEANNAVLVAAPPTVQERVHQLIEQLDKPPADQPVVKAYVPKNVRLQPLMSLLQTLFADGQTTFTTDLTKRRILVTATPAVHERIAEMVSQLDQPAEAGGPPSQRVFKLEHASAQSVATALQTLYPADTSNVRVAADDRNNLLIVVASEAVLKSVELMVKEIDKPRTEKAEQRVYQPQHVAASALLSTLQSLYGDREGTRISADPRGESIIVSAPPEVQKKIEALVKQLDQQQPAETAPVSQVYKLEHASPQAVVSPLQSLFPPETSRVRIAADTTNNAVIVTAPKAAQERIAKLIEQLDQLPASQRRVEKVYPIQNADPQAVLASLQQLYGPEASFLLDENNQAIIASATEAVQGKLAAVIEQLNKPGPSTAPLSNRVYQLRYASPQLISSALEAIYQKRRDVRAFADTANNSIVVVAPEDIQKAIAQMIADADKQGQARAPVQRVYFPKHLSASVLVSTLQNLFGSAGQLQIATDPRGLSIIITAPQSLQDRISDMLQLLDRPEDAQTAAQTRFYKLEHAAASAVISPLQTIFPPDTSRVRISPDSTNNAVIVTAPAATHQRIEELIKQLDQVPVSQRRTARVYTIRHADPQAVLSSLQSLYSSEATFVLDERNQAIIARASDQTHGKLATIIEQLDQAPATPAKPPASRVFRLRHASPDALSNALQLVYKNRRDVRILTDSANNSLIVVAPDQLLKAIAQMVTDADQPSQSAGQLERLYFPKHVSADKLVATLQTLYGSSGQLQITTDSRGTSIIMTGPAQLQQKASQMLSLLDRPPDAQSAPQSKAYSLQHASAAAVVGPLQSLFADQADRVKISADTTNNVVLVTAPASVHEQIAKLIQEADQPAPSARRVDKLYQIKHADLTAVLTAVQNLYRDQANVVLDLTNRAIIVNATEDVQAKVAEVIKQLDQPPAKGQQRSERTYRLRYVTPTSLASALQSLYQDRPDVRIVGEDQNRTLLVIAPEEIQKAIGQMVADADQENRSAGQVDQIYTPQHLPASKLAATLQQVFQTTPEVRISADPSGTSVIVNAPESVQQRVSKLVATLDKPPPAEAAPESHAYSLRHATASYVVTPLQTLFADLSDRVHISADPTNNVVMVTAPAAVHQQISKLIEEIDQPSPTQQRIEKVYSIQHVDASSVVTALQTLYGSDASIVLDAANRAVIVRAAQEVQQRVGQVVEQLDRSRDGGQRSQKVYRLRFVTPDSLASALQSLYRSRVDVQIVTDAANKSLIVVAPEQVQQAIGRMVADADQENAEAGTLQRLYFPRHVAAARLVATLQQVYGPSGQVQVSADPHGGAIIVNAPGSLQKKISQMLSLLDRPPDPASAPDSRVYPLKHANAATVTTPLQTLFADEADRVTITADATNNMVIVTAPAAAHERIAKLIEQMDQPSAATNRVDRVYTIQHADLQAVLSSLQTLYSGQANIVVDVTNQAIIVNATEQVQAKIAEVVRQLDRARPQGGQRSQRTYRLRGASPSSLATALLSLYRGRPDVQVVADEQNQSLLVVAPADVQKQIEAMVKEADQEPEFEVVEQVYRPKHADPSSLLTTLESLYGTGAAARWGRGAGPGRAPATFSLDPATGSIVAVASAPLQQRIRATFELLDQPPDPKARGQLKRYPLQNVTAASVAEALTRVYGQNRRVQVFPDAAAQTVLVVAPAGEHQQIEELIEQIDQPSLAATDRTVAVFNLYEVDPFAAASTVRNLFSALPPAQQPFVQSDTELDRLIVRGTEQQIGQVRSLLVQLGEDPSLVQAQAAQEGTVRTIRVPRGSPRALATALERLWPSLRKNPLRIVVQSVIQSPPSQRPAPAPPAKPPKKRINHLEQRGLQLPALGQAGNRPTQKDRARSAPAAAAQQPAGGSAAGTQPPHKRSPPAEVPGEEHQPVVLTITPTKIIAASSDKEALNLLQQLARSLTEVPEPEQGEFTVFYLQVADANSVADTINQAFNGTDLAGRPAHARRYRAGMGERVRVVPNPDANLLLVRASPIDLIAIQEMIQAIDSPELAAGAEQTHIVPLQKADASEVAQTLREVYRNYIGEEPISGRAPTATTRMPVSIAVDLHSNSLIITAPDRLFKRMQDLVEQLEKAAGDTSRQYLVSQLYRPRHISASSLYSTLQTLYGSRSLARSTPAGGAAPPMASFSLDATSQAVVAVAPAPIQARIKATFELLDQAPDPNTQSELKRYDIQHVSPTSVANAISGMYRQNARVQAFADTASSTVVVVAPAAEQEQIEKLVRQIDRQSAAEPVEQVYRPQHVSASSLLPTLESLYGTGRYGRGAVARAQFSVDEATQSLVAVAPPEVQKRIAATVQLLDQAPDPSTRGELKRYSVQHAAPSSIAEALNGYYGNNPRVQVFEDAESATLAVLAPAAEHEQIAKLIEELDKPGEQQPVEQVYRPKHMDPSAMISTLESLYGSASTGYRYGYRYSRGRGRRMTARFTLDPATRSIVAVAPPALQERIKATFELLDQPADPGTRGELKRYPVQHVDPTKVSDALSGVYGDDRRVQIFADSAAGSLVVVAPHNEHQQIEQLIKEMDRPSEAQSSRVIHVFNLSRASPFTAASTLRDAFSSLPANQQPFVEADVEPDRLVVRATQEQIDQMRRLLVQLGEDPLLLDAEAAQNSKIRSIIVRRGSPRALALAIERVWPKLRRNPLQVLVQSAYSPASAASMLRTLQSEQARPEKKPSPQPKRHPEKTPAKQLPGDPNVPVILTATPTRLIAASNDPEALTVVEQLARSLSEIPEEEQGEFAVYYLQMADATSVATAVDEAFNGPRITNGRRRFQYRPERVRVVPSQQANALLVRASPADLVQVEEMIKALDAPEATLGAEDTHIVPLKKADAAQVAEILNQVYQNYITSPVTRSAAGRYVGGGRVAVSIQVDARSNSLVITAPPQLFTQMEKLINELEQAAAQSTRAYRVVPLLKSNALDAQRTLQILLDHGRRRSLRSGTSGRSPGTRSRRRTRSRSSGRSSYRPPSRTGRQVGRAANPRADRRTKVATIRIKGNAVEVTERGSSRAQPGTPSTGGTRSVASAAGRRSGAAAANHVRLGPPMLNATQPADRQSQGRPVVLASYEQPEPAEEGQQPEAMVFSDQAEVEALPDLNVLLLWGTEEDLEVLSELVKQIEQLGTERALTLRLVPLGHVKASRMATLVDELYTTLVNARGAATPTEQAARIIPLAKPNAILLAVPKTDVDQLVGLIRNLDQPVWPSTQFRIFRLKHAAAGELAQLVTQFFANREADGELAQQVTVTSDVRSNSLIVVASPRDMAEAERLVAELDVETTESVNTLQVFPLQNTLASELASVLNDAISPAATAAGPGAVLRLVKPDAAKGTFVESGILDNVRITPNTRANTLIVSAPAKTMGLIAELIHQLDVPPAIAGEIKVFTLENSDATRMARTLQTLFQQVQQVGGTVTTGAAQEAAPGEMPGSPLVNLTFSVDERTNSILVSGSRAQLQVVEAIILRLDGSDVLERTVSVYRLKNATANEVAQALSQFIQSQLLQQIQQAGVVGVTQLREQNVVVVPEPITNSLLISASPRVYPEIEKLIEQIDEAPRQVVIQVLIAEVTLTEDEEFGIELGIQDSILFRRGIFPGTATLEAPFLPVGLSISTTQPPGVPGFNFNNETPGNNPTVGAGHVAGQALSHFSLGRTGSSGYGGLVLSASSENVSLLLRALKAQGRLTVLSRPQIMTVDNQEAFIQVGRKVPIVTNSVITTQGTIINPVEFNDVGIILLVLPKINPDGTVMMRVDPEISDLSPEKVQISENTFAPIIDTTRAETTVSAQDGQTVIIGGLITNRDFQETRKVPFLGDLPLIDWLFRFDQRDHRKRELLILLTPHVVRTAEEAEMVKRMEAERMDWILEEVEEIHGPVYGIPQPSGQPEEQPSKGGKIITPQPSTGANAPTDIPGNRPLQRMPRAPHQNSAAHSKSTHPLVRTTVNTAPAHHSALSANRIPSTINPQPSTLNPQPSAPKTQVARNQATTSPKRNGGSRLWHWLRGVRR